MACSAIMRFAESWGTIARDLLGETESLAARDHDVFKWD